MPDFLPGGLAPLQLVDAVACAMLAAAASSRARLLGANFLGACVLGCICGLFAPLCREVLLVGNARPVLLAMPDSALLGAVGGLLALLIARKIGRWVFFWLDAASMGLAGCLAASLAVAELGIMGALVLGLICGLGPGLVRDMALGDTAMVVELEWYAGSLALGIMLAILVFLWAPHIGNLPLYGILSGSLLVIILRGLRGRAQIE